MARTCRFNQTSVSEFKLRLEKDDITQVLKELHDQLLEERPESAEHVEAECPFCNELETSGANDEQQGDSVKTYTEDEYNSVLAQVADLETKVGELSAARQESEIESKIVEIKAQHEAQLAELQQRLEDQVAELQAQLDTTVLEAQAAKDEKDEIVSYLVDLEAESTRAQELARLQESRVALVKEQTSFPESRITERASAWAAMDEEAFMAALEDWKSIAPKAASQEDIPVSTAMTASHSDKPSGSVLRDVLGLRFQNIDPRKLI